jgi:hypothetical protein
MSIKQYLAGRQFAPETVFVMSAALAEACMELGFDANRPSRALVAQTIIAIVEQGETDADQLAVAVIEAMRGPKSAIA